MYLLLSNLIILSKAERLHRKFLYKLLIFCATYYLFICFDCFYYKYFWHYDYFFDCAHLYSIHFALSVPPECHIVCFSLVQTDHPAQQPTEYWLHMNFLPAHTLWAVSDTLHTSFLSSGPDHAYTATKCDTSSCNTLFNSSLFLTVYQHKISLYST